MFKVDDKGAEDNLAKKKHKIDVKTFLVGILIILIGALLLTIAIKLTFTELTHENKQIVDAYELINDNSNSKVYENASYTAKNSIVNRKIYILKNAQVIGKGLSLDYKDHVKIVKITKGWNKVYSVNNLSVKPQIGPKVYVNSHDYKIKDAKIDLNKDKDLNVYVK